MLLIIFLIVLLALFTIYKLVLIKNKYLNLVIKYLIISLIVALSLEISLFNFRHYQSLFNPSEIKFNIYTLGSGINCNNGVCEVLDKENAYIEITNINSKANNLYLDIVSDNSLFMKYSISYTDEANKLYMMAGEREYTNEVNRSSYVHLNPSGKIGNIKIDILESNTTFKINEIAINKTVPFFINNIRLIICLIFTFFILCINPKSKLQELKYNFKHSKWITCLLVIIIAGSFSFFTLANCRSYTVKRTSQYTQYKNLARALAKGHFYLDLKVSPELASLENPYDRTYRDSLMEGAKDYYWDYAYYQGKYYSYFGVVPCLLTYLPYYAITHKDLPNTSAMSVGIFLLTISAFYLVYNLIKKYYKKTPYIWYILLSTLLVFVSGIVHFSGEATFYNLPIIYGVSFALFGLAFWLKSTFTKELDKKYLFLGSLSMALVSGCRPQILLTSFFAIIIFWDYVFKKRELLSKKSIKETLLFALPFVVIAIALMYYNYARFGSVFDFGANYNLTTNDMTKRGWKFDRIFLGLYYFLLAPSKINLIFPFIENQKVLTSYLGKTIYEAMPGGFLFTNMICLLGLFSYKFKNIIKDKKLYQISIASVIMAIIIVILDTQMAGILPRYLCDFGFLFGISTIIVILSLLNNNLNIEYQKLIVVAIVICLLLHSFSFFTCRNVLINYDYLIAIYYKIYYTFMFWL